jgi:hypothetical protein
VCGLVGGQIETELREKIMNDARGRKELRDDIVHMPLGLFAQDPETLAASLASKEVSPQGPATGLRLLTFYITRAGRRLSASRLKKLEKARKLLSMEVEKALRQADNRKIA